MNELQTPPSNTPPEEQFRQPGALEHGKKNWLALHHILAFILMGTLGLAIVAGAYYYQVSQNLSQNSILQYITQNKIQPPHGKLIQIRNMDSSLSIPKNGVLMIFQEEKRLILVEMKIKKFL
jgi:hypothetical protein